MSLLSAAKIMQIAYLNKKEMCEMHISLIVGLYRLITS